MMLKRMLRIQVLSVAQYCAFCEKHNIVPGCCGSSFCERHNIVLLTKSTTLCFSQKLDPQHPLHYHEPPPKPMKQ